MTKIFRFFLCVFLLGVAGCTGVPENVAPVQNFQLDRYLGTWYEIARLDHSFERGLSRVTAEYSRNPDGSVRVVNRGYSREQDKWKQAEGRATFVDREDTGHLQVSFFGPFYASYVIVELDKDYQYALVSGYSKSYLWILSRTPSLPQGTVSALVQRAAELGYPTERLIFVDQAAAPALP
ncbi:apolipoprotein D and lipocalin family protein [Microbulbifer donghaiensis]|uniref:Outer membrane lipoprotein Blc n=1 Tax=Microbulbifer donghaiensis TaxID=494016 RepID=A0A1M5B2F2_9GAMM|nr:lipocalin family protein [Microbulbifer donghaiensis]SHF36731.1 apolipoprotein D and lipocalin family protein [Microbulbifer donghaiensis]